jgi:hypothetical protein
MTPKEIEQKAELYYLETKFRTSSSKRHFISGAKFIQERMYSEEDLRKAFRQGQDNMDYSEMFGWDSKLTEQQWFEQYKKK